MFDGVISKGDIIYFTGTGDEKTGDLYLYTNQDANQLTNKVYLTLKDILTIWNNRKNKEKILLIILDSCHSGH